MSLSRSWQFIGGTESIWYRAYDWLRQGVNRRLVRYFQTFVHRSGEACRALEAGSGTAYAASLLSRQPGVGPVVCVDLDLEALQHARQRDPNLLAVVGDIRRMPFADNAFSFVFNSSTVEHLETPTDAVREMRRVCKDDGHVFVGVPYVWGPLWFQPLIRRSAVGVWLGTVFTRSRLDRMMVQAGLNPIAHIRYFLNFFVGAVATRDVSRCANDAAGGGS